MQGFGDVSGHFRSLIIGECDVVVVGVVFGDLIQANRCAKQTVRNVQDVEEAKWSDLTETQKRRFIDCLTEHDDTYLGYAKFTRKQLRSLKDQYLLYQDVSFPPDWDLALTGYAYGELLFERGARDENRVDFVFDHVASQSDSADIATHIEEFVPGCNPKYKSSHSSLGIQTADCFAGAVAEDHKKGTDWLSTFDADRIMTCTETALAQFQNDLDRYDR
ncbi:DUF3800 domain-containing protein [Natronorubrum daqingense]|uniref:Uncharacterized protein n=1 Tax=Natronorubrum daqingense TaxID=588898 RepID=A0A1N7FZ32_9EURY|nr:DUF3800 domain-containing protein [Natronorubrum daqingense]APX98580.1 hypothetical protein BB347_17925 [Natronorubrum daqingense]SIS05588.1 hypothetical protein SAMN05421809_3596 [Natronorubrum daqingense]